MASRDVLDDRGRSRRAAARVLGAIGLVGAISTAVVAFAGQGDWGPPGTVEYQTYELVNRLTAVTIVLMVAAPIGLRLACSIAGMGRRARVALALTTVGLVTMVIGSMAEFWLFSSAAYEGPGSEGRNVAFLGFELGALLTLLGAIIAGIALMRGGGIAGRIGIAILVSLAIGFALAFVGAPLLIFVPLIAATMAGGALLLTSGR